MQIIVYNSLLAQIFKYRISEKMVRDETRKNA